MKSMPSMLVKHLWVSSTKRVLLIGFIVFSLMLSLPGSSYAAPGDLRMVSISLTNHGGNDPSDNPSVSTDGRYVAFDSMADDLVSGNIPFSSHIFVRDRLLGQTKLISDDTTWSKDPSISADGRYVTYMSTEVVTSERYNVFVYDMYQGSTTLLSYGYDGTPANGDSKYAVISSDGTSVAFQSSASNLIQSDVNGKAPDIFVYDLIHDQISIVSVSTDGHQSSIGGSTNPSISANGDFVAFRSSDRQLVSGDTNLQPDMFVRELVTGVTTRVSVASDGTQANDLTDDYSSVDNYGNVVFASHATNLVPEDTNSGFDVFVHKLATGVTTRVSVASDGTQGINSSGIPGGNTSTLVNGQAITADGRYVLFRSIDNNLVPGDSNSGQDLFIHDMATRATTRVSVAFDGKQAHGHFWTASLSNNGLYLVFSSDSKSLLPEGVQFNTQVYIRENAISNIPVTISGNAGAGGTTLSYQDGTDKAVLSDANGNYSINVSYGWSGDITPSHPCFVFDPVHRSYINVTGSITSENYMATPSGPCVLSIVRLHDSPNAQPSVDFNVTFTESVTGVDVSDFALSTTTVSGASVITLTGMDAVYTVSVNTGSGNGMIRLDLLDDDSIHNAADDPLGGTGPDNGDFTNGEIYSIVKTAPKPAVPALVSPATGALVSTLQPALDWKDSVPAAHYYQLQISTNTKFTGLVIDEGNVPISSFALTSSLLPGTRYYWRVRAFNVPGASSAWSTARTFKTPLAQPVLVAPADTGSLLTDRPTFDWDTVEAATNYNLQVSALSNFSTLLVNAAVNETDYTMTKDLPQNKTLYWRVRAKTSVVAGPWSIKWSFTTGNPPTVPVPVAPLNNALVKDFTPLFSWNSSTKPTGTTFQRYEIQVDDNGDFSSPVIDASTTPGDLADSDFTSLAELVSITKYYWRVRAVNSINTVEHTSGWSAVWSFRTSLQPPTGLLVIPNGQKPSFEWDDTTEPFTNYAIQISTSVSFSTLLVNGTTPGSSYTMLKNLPAGKLFYWRVRVNGPNGPSAWATTQFITP